MGGLQRPVDQGTLRIGVESGPVIGRDGGDEETGGIGGVADQGQDRAVAGIEGDDGSRFAPFCQERLSRLLKVATQGGVETTGRGGRLLSQSVYQCAVVVNERQRAAAPSGQVGLAPGFQASLAHQFVAPIALLVPLFQVFFVNRPHVADDVRRNAARWIGADFLFFEFDARQRGESFIVLLTHFRRDVLDRHVPVGGSVGVSLPDFFDRHSQDAAEFGEGGWFVSQPAGHDADGDQPAFGGQPQAVVVVDVAPHGGTLDEVDTPLARQSREDEFGRPDDTPASGLEGHSHLVIELERVQHGALHDHREVHLGAVSAFQRRSYLRPQGSDGGLGQAGAI